MFFSIACVSAADDNQTDEVAIQDDTISQDILTEDDSNFGNFSSLKEEVSKSQGSKYLELDKNYKFDRESDPDLNNGVKIDIDDFVIDGKGYEVSGNGEARIFDIQANNVTLKNIYFINGNSSSNGEAVYFNGNGAMENCYFTDNVAANNGGAIYFNGAGTVTGCGFTASAAASDGGAIYFKGTGNLTDCYFDKNMVDGDNVHGGAVYFNDDGDMAGCNFTENQAHGIVSTGGAVYFNGNGNAFDCSFTDNQANGENYSYGGALAFNMGGNGIGNIDYCNFTNNQVTTADYISGLALGGAVEIRNKRTVVTNSQFTSNSASNGGGAIDLGHGTIANCSFTYNTVTDADDKRGGGAIYLSFGNVTDCDFTENVACGQSACGGAICVDKDADGNITGSRFTGNNAINGGAICFYKDGSIDDCNFTHNQASRGGAIYFESNAIVTNSQFNNNAALFDIYYSGGAIYVSNNGTIDSCEFTGNAAWYGGAVAANNGTITNSNFTDNWAINGGALNAGDLVVSDSNFTNNKADTGGAISIYGDLTVNGGIFEGNVATDGTNNIASNRNGKIILNNTTPKDLGPFYLAGLSATVSNITYGGVVNIMANVTDMYGNPIKNGTVSVTINSKTYSATIDNGTATIEVPKLNAGTYNGIEVVYNGNGTYAKSFEEVDFTVSKANAAITAGDARYIINYDGSYSATLKGVVGEKVIFTLNGKNIGSAVTNAKGVATIKLTAKILKTAKAGTRNLIIKLSSSNYNPASKTVKIKINKEKTKIVAKKKTFKRKVKTKKYSITLKNSKGKAVKKVKVTIKIGKKTFKAKTNAKGKAVFKIKKMTKKRTYKAKVTFKGNAYYNKVTKKVKIRIK